MFSGLMFFKLLAGVGESLFFTGEGVRSREWQILMAFPEILAQAREESAQNEAVLKPFEWLVDMIEDQVRHSGVTLGDLPPSIDKFEEVLFRYFRVVSEMGSEDDQETMLFNCKISALSASSQFDILAEYYSNVVSRVDGLDSAKLAMVDDNHPGRYNRVYLQRRQYFTDLVASAKGPFDYPDIDYTWSENKLWRFCAHSLREWREKVVHPEIRSQVGELDISEDSIPAIGDVSATLHEKRNIQLQMAAGLIPSGEFLARLAGSDNARFSAAPFIRSGGNPPYTPEPDIIHEFLGHVVQFSSQAVTDTTKCFGKATLAILDGELAKRITNFTSVVSRDLNGGVSIPIQYQGLARQLGISDISAVTELRSCLIFEHPLEVSGDEQPKVLAQFFRVQYALLNMAKEFAKDEQFDLAEFERSNSTLYQLVKDSVNMEMAIQRLANLYWYTVEFGVARSDDGERYYGIGSGPLSSIGEMRNLYESQQKPDHCFSDWKTAQHILDRDNSAGTELMGESDLICVDYRDNDCLQKVEDTLYPVTTVQRKYIVLRNLHDGLADLNKVLNEWGTDADLNQARHLGLDEPFSKDNADWRSLRLFV